MSEQPQNEVPRTEPVSSSDEALTAASETLGGAASETPEGAASETPETLSRENDTVEPLVEGSPSEGGESASVESAPDEPTWRRFDLRTERDAALQAAQQAIAAGECIVLPTDTVYGIGANAFSADAVQRLLDAKHRGRDMPPPVLISEPALLEALGSEVESHALRLAEECWPGALTLIVTMQPSLRVDLGETRGSIALRVPDHDDTRDLLRRTGPLAVSSANVSGRPASTTIDAAIEMLGNSVSVYLDAGPTPGETPSTMIDFVSSAFGKVVRRGALSIERIHEFAPFVEDLETAPDSDPQTTAADDAEPDLMGHQFALPPEMPTEPTQQVTPMVADAGEGAAPTDSGLGWPAQTHESASDSASSLPEPGFPAPTTEPSHADHRADHPDADHRTEGDHPVG